MNSDTAIQPIPKPKESFSKSLLRDDFRGIAISPILSKVWDQLETSLVSKKVLVVVLDSYRKHGQPLRHRIVEGVRQSKSPRSFL